MDRRVQGAQRRARPCGRAKRAVCTDGCTEGWWHGWMGCNDGWIDGSMGPTIVWTLDAWKARMNGSIDRRVDVTADERSDGGMVGCIDRSIDSIRSMDRWISERKKKLSACSARSCAPRPAPMPARMSRRVAMHMTMHMSVHSAHAQARGHAYVHAHTCTPVYTHVYTTCLHDMSTQYVYTRVHTQ